MTNVESVKKLAVFDQYILDVAIDILEKRKEALIKQHKDNPMITGENAIQSLKNVRNTGSLKLKYQVMYNQCIVLLVSYFGFAVKEHLREFIDAVLESPDPGKIGKEDIKINLERLRDLRDQPGMSIGDFYINQNSISGQDMQSIHRFLDRNLGTTPPKDEIVNNIILSQAARHVIVHSGGQINERFINQVSGAKPRTIMSDLTMGEIISFTPKEIEIIGDNMRCYLQQMAGLLSGDDK